MIPNSVVPSGKRARAVAAFSLALLLAIGCRRKQPEPQVELIRPPPPPAEQPPAPPPAPPPPFRDPPAWQKPRPQASQDDDLTRAIFEQKTPEAQKPRDFSAELQRMLTGANTCLQPRPEGNNSPISVSVTAHVMPGGNVSRGEVSGLQDEERACLRARVEALQFGPPIDNAPLTVMASLQLTPKQIAAPKQDAPKVDSLGMTITQAPSGEGITPGIVPKEDPGVIPPGTPGVVPPADPGVPIAADPGVIPTPDAPAEVIPIPPPVQQ